MLSFILILKGFLGDVVLMHLVLITIPFSFSESLAMPQLLASHQSDKEIDEPQESVYEYKVYHAPLQRCLLNP